MSWNGQGCPRYISSATAGDGLMHCRGPGDRTGKNWQCPGYRLFLSSLLEEVFLTLCAGCVILFASFLERTTPPQLREAVHRDGSILQLWPFEVDGLKDHSALPPQCSDRFRSGHVIKQPISILFWDCSIVPGTKGGSSKKLGDWALQQCLNPHIKSFLVVPRLLPFR